MALPQAPTPTPVPPSPTPTAPSVTPTATIAPEMLPALAQAALEDGEYALAISLWQEALSLSAGAERAERAVALGRAYLAAERYGEAIVTLTEAITDTLPLDQQAMALALLGRSYEARGDRREAIAAYERHLALEQDAEPYVRWRVAKLHEALGETEAAAEEIRRIELTELPSAMQAEILERLATHQRTLENYDGALETYERILAFAQLPDYRALVRHRMGETWLQSEQRDEAVAAFQGVLTDHPTSYAALLSLRALDELESAELSGLERGRILYHAGR
ncbi:MAG: tetratricopeptide repeat protein, partial [Chloroflexi bacterium]|nr:tetratricopeptide repeat protein [Chloroflexota bacterium]